jgi:hypothetical protein
MKLRRAIFLGVICVAMFAVAAPAWAATPAQNAYNQFSQFNQSNSTLPFTGIDVGAVALIGALLIGAGLAVRYRMRARLD